MYTQVYTGPLLLILFVGLLGQMGERRSVHRILESKQFQEKSIERFI
jgi:hypothetical protein